MYHAFVLLLIILSTPSAPPFYVKASIFITTLQLLLPIFSITIFLPGQLAAAWICLQPNLFPIPKALPSFLPKALYCCWILRTVLFCKETSIVGSSTLTTIIEGPLLFMGLLWRTYIIAMQLRATPPIAMATPILSAIMPLFHYDEKVYYNVDGSTDEIVEARKRSMKELSSRWGPVGKRSKDVPGGTGIDRLAVVRKYLADIRFTKTVSAFFPFQKYTKQQLDPSFVLDHVTDDNHLIDQDGTKLWDCDCSFGVNVLGYQHYKRFLKNGFEDAKERSVCLGKLTPQVSNNAERICKIANKEQCSFHMSGTEAIMGAVRLARFNTGRPLICVFGGAYHGWYDGVMQLGTSRPTEDLLVLKYGSDASLELLSARRHEIAAVLVNPLCALDINKPPPADFSLLSNIRGKTDPDNEKYGAWLRRLVETCRSAGIVSISDEVYVGFRYARGGAQEFFNVDFDVVCYGKTLGGGLPCGVIAGPKHFLNRSTNDSPLKKAIVIGTFSNHPMVMSTMSHFLDWTDTNDCKKAYATINEKTATFVKQLNVKMVAKQYPLHLVNVGSVWGIRYTKPGRYHWMLQFFILNEGIKLSSIGTGRMNLSLETTDEELETLTFKLLSACEKMVDGGWWNEQAKIKTTPQIFQAIGKDVAKEWFRRIKKAVMGMVQQNVAVKRD